MRRKEGRKEVLIYKNSLCIELILISTWGKECMIYSDKLLVILNSNLGIDLSHDLSVCKKHNYIRTFLK